MLAVFAYLEDDNVSINGLDLVDVFFSLVLSMIAGKSLAYDIS